MSNELLLVLSLFVYFGGFTLFYYLFGKYGLLIWNCLALILANTEVLLLIDGFGIAMTLGNVCFATSFLVSDLLCEKYGQRDARMAVLAGFLVTAMFVIISQYWLLYTPSAPGTPSDMMPHFEAIFSNTPRIIFAGISVYVVIQLISIKLYFFWWKLTEKIVKNKKGLLWVRSSISTTVSQFLNSVLFNTIAFYGVFTNAELIQVIISTFLIYLVITLLNIPIMYLNRMIKPLNLLDSVEKKV